MLMQFVAWVLATPAIILILAYAMIFTSMLAAKIRQTHAAFQVRHASAAVIHDPRTQRRM